MEFRKLDLEGAVFVKADAVTDISATRLANAVYDKLIKKVQKVELNWHEEKLHTGVQEGFVVTFKSSRPYVNFELMLSMRSKDQLAAFYRRKGKPDLIILNIVKRIKRESIVRQMMDPNSRLSFIHEFVHHLDAKKFHELSTNKVTASEFPEFERKDSSIIPATVKYFKSLGVKAIAEKRKDGLKSWESLKKSSLFPSHKKPPEGFLKACQAGIYITAENGDQWHTYPNGIRGYSALYVTPFEISPMQILDSSMKPITLKNLQYGKCLQCEQN